MTPEDTSEPPGRAAVGWWLAALAAMVFAMVVLGGATRLTESGLSITDWRPVTGVLPPLSDADWQAAYERYRVSPEFQRRNFWMSVEDFKTIFWLEYVHRLWGRLLGVAFLLPFLWFLWRGKIGRAMGWRLAGVFALGGAQGLLGWLMVKSGLVDRPDVSHYRLAMHLLLAFAIYGWLAWLALGCLRPRQGGGPAPRPLAAAVLFWVTLTVIYGAFVAGLDAGFIYNSFPLMGGKLVPPDAWVLTPRWLNPVENAALIQFIHRMLGLGVAPLALLLWWRGRRAAIGDGARAAIAALAVMALLQTALGIGTLLSGVVLPVALLHQTGALVLFTLALWTLYELAAGPPAAAGRRLPNSSAPIR